MQTAAIGYRVADFLKQHPPFNSVEEPDLLTLVSRGRSSPTPQITAENASNAERAGRPFLRPHPRAR